MKRIGIFGGTFAPFHLGHLQALKAFLREVNPDRCLVIPSGIPPHKTKTALFSDEERLQMTRLACQVLPNTEVWDWEIQKSGRSYTCETLKHLNETEEGALVLYVGSDMFLTLHQWYQPQEIFSRAEIAAFSRTGEDLERLKEQKARLEQTFRDVRCTVYTVPPFPVSSTEIREKWERGEDISPLVPPSVHRFLEEKRENTLQTYDKLLHQRLSEHRLRHSEGVMEEAEALARIHGVNPQKAKIAGLLHDITKEFSREEHLRLFEKYDPTPQETIGLHKNLWHAISASYDLTETLGITDPEIISAVRYHSTGKADMTPLETILFVADAIEPNRGYEDLEFYRAVAREDLNKAAYLITVWTVEDLKKRNLPCHRDMLDACAHLAERYGGITAEAEKERLNL